ncbi:MAG: hypothetical protein ACOX05_01005 [Bacillota bacterium]|jgi:hypothetical protein
MDKDNHNDRMLLFSVPIVAMAITQGMNDDEKNLVASFFTAVADCIFLMSAAGESLSKPQNDSKKDNLS